MQDVFKPRIEGFISVKDKETGEVLVDKKNAIHYGNISSKIAQAFCGKSSAFVTYMAFGNAGVEVSESGLITYRTPNVSNSKVPTASLYNTTYVKEMINYHSDGATDLNRDVSTTGLGTYEDISCVVELGPNEPSNQQLMDLANGVNSDTLTNTEYVFNEIALYAGPKNKGNKSTELEITEFLQDASEDKPTLITHVVFHPIQKSYNRTLEITYKLRIQMGD